MKKVLSQCSYAISADATGAGFPVDDQLSPAEPNQPTEDVILTSNPKPTSHILMAIDAASTSGYSTRRKRCSSFVYECTCGKQVSKVEQADKSVAVECMAYEGCEMCWVSLQISFRSS